MSQAPLAQRPSYFRGDPGKGEKKGRNKPY
jgi:hypothetical protein